MRKTLRILAWIVLALIFSPFLLVVAPFAALITVIAVLNSLFEFAAFGEWKNPFEFLDQ
jgi:hypothetical protein